MTTKKTELAEIEQLERENRELKQKVGAYSRQVLLEVRAIQLRNENKCLRDIAAEIELHAAMLSHPLTTNGGSAR